MIHHVKAGDEITMTYNAAVDWFGEDFLDAFEPPLRLVPLEGDEDGPLPRYYIRRFVDYLRERSG